MEDTQPIIIIEPDENDPTKALITTPVPNYISNLKSKIQEIDSQIESKQAALDQVTAQLNQRADGFRDEIAQLQLRKDVIVQKIEEAVDSGITE